MVTSSPTTYGGNDLRIAQNVIAMRDGNIEGLSKRPGLRPLTTAGLGDDTIYSIFGVPLADATTTPVTTYAPLNGSAPDDIAELAKFSDWSTDPREVYALRLLSTTDTKVYYAGNDGSATQVPSLYVSSGGTGVPIFTPRRTDDVIPDAITCVRALRRPDGTAIIYFAVASINDVRSLLTIYGLEVSSGVVTQVGVDIEFRFNAIVTDIIHRNGGLLLLIAAPNNPSCALRQDGDAWLEAFSLGTWFPLSGTKDEAGNIYVGTSNRRDTSERAAILRWSAEGGEVEDVRQSPLNVGYAHFSALVNFEGDVYAGAFTETPDDIDILQLSGDTWSVDRNVKGTDTGLYGAANYLGSSAVIDGSLLLVLPGQVALKRTDDVWAADALADYRGPIGGILT